MKHPLTEAQREIVLGRLEKVSPRVLAEALCDSLEQLSYEGQGVDAMEVNACFTETVRLELSMHSGRPNPYKVLSAGESELFIEATRALKTRVPAPPPIPRLGGVSASWETGTILAQDGVVAYYRHPKIEPVHYADTAGIEALVRILMEPDDTPEAVGTSSPQNGPYRSYPAVEAYNTYATSIVSVLDSPRTDPRVEPETGGDIPTDS